MKGDNIQRRILFAKLQAKLQGMGLRNQATQEAK